MTEIQIRYLELCRRYGCHPEGGHDAGPIAVVLEGPDGAHRILRYWGDPCAVSVSDEWEPIDYVNLQHEPL